jgi:hypothetical protein
MTRHPFLHTLVVGTQLVALAACRTATGPDAIVMSGNWGGDHAVLALTATSASIEFDCAHGALPVPLPLDRGTFDVMGDYVQERGGPIRSDEPPAGQPARYIGTISGNTMTLQVLLTTTAQSVGTFSLMRGSSGRLFKCL